MNPVFWRLHGWVDDRIEAWFRAQESARPGVVKRKTLKGLPWFEKGPWVLKDNPFDWPEFPSGHGHGGHGGHGGGHGHGGGLDEAKELEVLLKVMERLREVNSRPDPVNRPSAEALLVPVKRRASGFARDLDIDSL